MMHVFRQTHISGVEWFRVQLAKGEGQERVKLRVDGWVGAGVGA